MTAASGACLVGSPHSPSTLLLCCQTFGTEDLRDKRATDIFNINPYTRVDSISPAMHERDCVVADAAERLP